MKFHPYSTHNSTAHKPLIIKAVTTQRWKGGITNDKIYFSEKRAGKVLTTIKEAQIKGSNQGRILVKI